MDFSPFIPFLLMFPLFAFLFKSISGRKGGMEDYEGVVTSIAADYDLTSDLGRRKAFNACAHYADERLIDNIDYNYFMSLAGKRFQCPPVFKDVLRLVPSDGSEKVILEYIEKSGPCLAANRSGLTYLSKALAILATSRMSGDHFHLRYHGFPMVGRSFPLIAYLEDEAWFEDQIKKESSAKDTTHELPRRDIDPDQVRAFIITDQMPSEFLLTPGQVYLVHHTEKLRNQKICTRHIRENTERMYMFEFTNDGGDVTNLGLDLDDNGILFLTENSLKQLLP